VTERHGKTAVTQARKETQGGYHIRQNQGSVWKCSVITTETVKLAGEGRNVSVYKLISESKLFQKRVWLRASSKILTKTTSHTRYCRNYYIQYTLLSLQSHSVHITVATITFSTRYFRYNYIQYTLLSQQLRSVHVTVATITFSTRYCRSNYVQYMLLSLQLHSVHVTLATITFSTRYCHKNYNPYKLLYQHLYEIHVNVTIWHT
jgi:hypothetical protein